MWKKRLSALLILTLGVLAGYFVYNTQVRHPDSKYAFSLGLDLSGGSHLIYRADVSGVDENSVKDAMATLRDIIERRVNLFGVSETNVQVQEANFANSGENRLIVDLPGITDIKEAIKIIGTTPLLEFKVERPEGPEKTRLIAKYEKAVDQLQKGEIKEFPDMEDPYFIPTQLSGRYLKRANIDFQQGAGVSGSPVVSIEFDKTGAELFRKITEENLGKQVAIYLDGDLKSAPTVQSVISDGKAVITGNFTPDEAKELASNLSYGALPLPIELVSTQIIGASLGAEATQAGIFAGLVGFMILSILMIIWYRLPGVVSVVALLVYISIMGMLIKIIPITLSAAGIAGFIISLGLAVDGNILIAERMKEELKDGRNIADSIKTGFSRAWLSIRDSNISSIITAVILFWFGSSLVQGFALTLGLGSIISMFSAVTVSRVLLLGLGLRESKVAKFLFSSGFSR